jgi:hypothetical protein
MRNNSTVNPPGTTQTADGCVISGAPVYDEGRRTWIAPHCGHTDTPDHIAARRGEAGHQR